MPNQIVISRIQNRRGIRENLPQPLLPGEFALTIDTGELWIGTDPNQPPWGVRTYGSGLGDIANAENIADLQIVAAQFSPALSQASFDGLVTYLTGTPTPLVDLADVDILWDGGSYVFVAADTSVDVANTVANVVDAIVAEPSVGGDYVGGAFAGGAPYRTLGAINDTALDPTLLVNNAFDSDGQFLLASGNANQGSNAARLINQINGAQLVTTISNLQVTTSGIGVGSSTFRDMTVVDAEPGGAVWLDVGTASADSVTDVLTWVSGEGINIEVDPILDALRITNTIDSVAAVPFTLTASTGPVIVPGLRFDMESPGTEISDVIILEYSANIGGAVAGVNNYTVIGTMHIVGNILVGAGTATLADSQVEVRDAGLPGALSFTASFSAGTGTGGADEIQIHYTNTFTTDAALRVLRRRWSSF